MFSGWTAAEREALEDHAAKMCRRADYVWRSPRFFRLLMAARYPSEWGSRRDDVPDCDPVYKREWRSEYDRFTVWGTSSARDFFHESQIFEKELRAAGVRHTARSYEFWAGMTLSREHRLRLIRRSRDRGHVDVTGWRALAHLEKERRQWVEARRMRDQVREQRRRLREGQTTLTAIRRYLRGQAPSPVKASELARTSPTS